jgi:hypothetical protein
MRVLVLFTIALLSAAYASAQKKLNKAQIVKALQQNLKNGGDGSSTKKTHRNSTAMFRDISKYKPDGNFTDKDFRGKIVSVVTWKEDELDIRNDIFENGLLKETYTYEIPINAITGASVTNCKRNNKGEVNAYSDRPIFVFVKDKTTKIGYTRYDKKGQVMGNTRTRYAMNNKDCDWNSAIPIAGDWDKNSTLEGQILQAFYRLGEMNEIGYSSK